MNKIDFKIVSQIWLKKLFTSVQVIQCPKFESNEPNLGQSGSGGLYIYICILLGSTWYMGPYIITTIVMTKPNLAH